MRPAPAIETTQPQQETTMDEWHEVRRSNRRRAHAPVISQIQTLTANIGSATAWASENLRIALPEIVHMNGRFVAVVRDPSRRPSSAPPTPPRLREPETLAMLSHALNVDEVWRTHWRFVPTYFLMDNARAHDDSDILYPFPVPDTSGSGTPDSMPPLSSSWSLEAPSLAEGNDYYGDVFASYYQPLDISNLVAAGNDASENQGSNTTRIHFNSMVSQPLHEWHSMVVPQSQDQ